MGYKDLFLENQILKENLNAEHIMLEQIQALNGIKSSEEFDLAINNMLKIIGEFTQADRSYIIEKNGDIYTNTFEWCAEGVESQRESLQALSEVDLPDWFPILASGECVIIPDVESIKNNMLVEYTLLKKQKVNAIAVLPIISNGRLNGLIGVDNTSVKTSESIIKLISVLGNYYGIVKDNICSYEKLEYRLTHDILTGAYNRHGFYTYAEEMIKSNPDKEYLLIVSDIKSFKLVNEIFGEEIADQILIDEAKWIKLRMKGNLCLGRLQADIFAMVLPKEFFDEKDIEKLLVDMREKYILKNFCLHMYLGVYTINDINEPIRHMVDKTILSISKIKGDLYKYVTYYDEKDYSREIEKQQMVGEFEHAIAERQFCMYLQPQTDKNGKMLGAEALIRWNHPTMGVVMPGAFIEHFENAGLIYKLDTYIWNEAAEKLRAWKALGYDYYISVNISAKDFYHIDVYQTFMKLVEKYDIDVDKLHIEITETALSEDETATHIAIEKLHDAGFVIEIDDFGSGYSSFNFLKDVCADVIKIDRVFLKESSHVERGEQILKSIISLSHEIGMNVITEGVETVEQLSMLSRMNCDWFQGYYFSKPVSVNDFEEKYDISRRVVCPVCEKYIFSKIGDNEICPICKWENDRIQYRDHDYAGGANELSVNQYRGRYNEK